MSSPADPVLPDYGGAWVGAVAPALLAGVRPPWLPAVVEGARSVILLVLDGLGWTMLERHRELTPTLAGMAGGPVTAVVPSTTSAALTSIATGRTPGEHGVLGYRIRVGGEVLNVLRWQGGAQAPEPEQVQPHPAFGGRDVPVVTKSEFRNTGFTKAHLRGVRFVGWRTTSTMVEHCRRLAASGRPFVYAYSDGIDKVAHEYGLRDGFLEAELRATDSLVVSLLDAVPQDVAVVVTADHGQVHVEADGHRRLEELEPMVTLMAGEGRFRTLWARPGAAGELMSGARERFGDDAWVRSREQAFDEGWFGPAGAEVRGRVGDVILAAREPVIFVDRSMPQETQMRSHHGSLTADEMLVPLLAARGRA